MRQGIVSVKPGKEIKTTNPLEWNLNTFYPLLKIFGVYTGNIPARTVGELGYATITHNLGYYPMTMFYCAANGTTDYFLLSGMTGGVTVGMEVTTTTCVLANLMDVTIPYMIIIFYDSIE